MEYFKLCYAIDGIGIYESNLVCPYFCKVKMCYLGKTSKHGRENEQFGITTCAQLHTQFIAVFM